MDLARKSENISVTLRNRRQTRNARLRRNGIPRKKRLKLFQFPWRAFFADLFRILPFYRFLQRKRNSRGLPGLPRKYNRPPCANRTKRNRTSLALLLSHSLPLLINVSLHELPRKEALSDGKERIVGEARASLGFRLTIGAYNRQPISHVEILAIHR